MQNKKFLALIATAAVATCLALAGCGGSQPAASSSAAASAAAPAASASAAATPAASSSAAASTSASAAATPAASSSAAASTTSTSASAAATPAASASAAATQTTSYIGDQAALNTALSHAGFAEGDVTHVEVELDTDDAVVHYDVNFKQGGMEYDYDIDAANGAILTSKSEVDD